jgi:hypothetical protein
MTLMNQPMKRFGIIAHSQVSTKSPFDGITFTLSIIEELPELRRISSR